MVMSFSDPTLAELLNDRVTRAIFPGRKNWETCVGRSNRARRQEKPMKEIMVAVVLMVATASPVFAQQYCACWGTGNVIDQPKN